MILPNFRSAKKLVARPLLLFVVANGLFLTVSSIYVIVRATRKPKNDYSIYIANPKDALATSQIVAADDVRPAILDKYLLSQGAPMAGQGKTLVAAADRYGLDWRLMAAIAMQESNAGKVMPRDSYNAWGWAIFTGKDSGTYFDSWEHAIETVSKGLAVYRDKYGLVTPEEIMTRYTPDSASNGGSWAVSVRYFMRLFESYRGA